jgi:DNA-binding FadR family transcriptional regulator
MVHPQTPPAEVVSGLCEVMTAQISAARGNVVRAYRMPIETVEPRRLYRQVADQLRHLIDRGEFAVGDRLPAERELSVQLGVSRPTVREALIALEVDGRVRIRMGSGIYVLPKSAERVAEHALPIAGPFDILQARSLFEGAIAEDAARLATADDIAAIDTLLDEMRSAAHPGQQSVSVDRAFHVAVAGILGNEAVTKVVGELFDQRINPYFARLASHFENADSWQAALNEHQTLRDQLAAHDAAGAKAAMQAHLRQSQIRFSKTFGEAIPAAPQRTGARQPGKTRTRVADGRKSSQETTKPRRTHP